MSGPVVVLAEAVTLAHGEHRALSDVDLELRAGQLVAVIGPNGSGKSTLLDSIAGLLKPRNGTLTVLGGEPGGDGVAYVFQATHTPQHMPLTVREVVTMGRYRRTGLTGRVGADGKAAIGAAMERVDIVNLAGRQLHELSGGQRQRVLVAQGLVAEADLLLLDEPMIGLDLVSKGQIMEVMNQERNDGRTVIFTTHDMGEARLADVAVLLSGKVISSGEPQMVLTDENLRLAYMGRLLDAPSGELLDDSHHHYHN
ncbi:MAG TPA: metal ABC transporter ATP-binding protein [Microthrixaceae bacterium]|nr:metal ABC transporter ATP-binding protein [Microthrixaceae bacterium]